MTSATNLSSSSSFPRSSVQLHLLLTINHSILWYLSPWSTYKRSTGEEESLLSCSQLSTSISRLHFLPYRANNSGVPDHGIIERGEMTLEGGGWEVNARRGARVASPSPASFLCLFRRTLPCAGTLEEVLPTALIPVIKWADILTRHYSCKTIERTKIVGATFRVPHPNIISIIQHSTNHQRAISNWKSN